MTDYEFNQNTHHDNGYDKVSTRTVTQTNTCPSCGHKRVTTYQETKTECHSNDKK